MARGGPDGGHHLRCVGAEILVRGVIDLLAEHGFADVQSVTTANETLVFALPRELRAARS